MQFLYWTEINSQNIPATYYSRGKMIATDQHYINGLLKIEGFTCYGNEKIIYLS